MKKKIFLKEIIASFTILTFYACCNHTETITVTDSTEKCKGVLHNIESKSNEDKIPVCIVLCDFTSSMDSASLDYTLQYSKKILEFYYGKAIVKFYPITTGNLLPFFESSTIIIPDSSKNDKATLQKYEACISLIKNEVSNSLNTAFSSASKKRPQDSYIIQTIERILTIIDADSLRRQNKNTLFILSDMLESGNSSFGKIDLEKQSYLEGLQILEHSIDSSTSLKVSGDLTIKVGLYSEQIKNFNELSSFWELFFNKIGYKKRVVLASEIFL